MNAFNVWFTNFQKTFNANAKSWGFSASDIKTVNQFFKNWQGSYNAWNYYNTFNKAYTQFQNHEFSFYQNFIMGFMNQIAKNKNFSGDWQYWFGTTATNIKAKTTAKKTTKKSMTAKATTSNTTKPAAKTTTKKSTRTSPRAKKTTSTKPVAKTTTKVIKKSTTTKPIAKSTVKAVKNVTTTSKATKRTAAAKKSVATKPMVAKATATKSVKKPITKKTAVKATAKPIAKSTKTVKATKAYKPKKSVKTVKSVTKAPVKTMKPAIDNTTSIHTPFVWFTSGKNGVNVYVGSNKNSSFKLPTGTKGAYVEYKNGGNTWKKLTQGAKFPFVHSYTGNSKVYYRACWINANGKKGAWSKPISLSSSTPKAAA